MNRRRMVLTAAAAFVALFAALSLGTRPAEAHGFYRFGFGYPVVYRPWVFAPPPPPVYYEPPVVSYYRPAYYGWYRRTVYRRIYHRAAYRHVAYRHVVHRHWCSCHCCS